MQDGLRELLEKRRNRGIAIILGVKERECDTHLPRDASQKLRKVVLDQMNEFHDLVNDILDSVDHGDVVLNEEWLRKLDEMHQALVPTNGRHP